MYEAEPSSADATAPAEPDAALSPVATAVEGDTPPPTSAKPAEEMTAEEQAAARESQLQRLYDRIHERKDLPSLKDSIRSIQQVTRSDKAHMRALTDEVLQDVALTNKLLRLINTAFYSSVGGGSITTITRAVALMGFQSVGMLAASLALFDRLPKGSDGHRVREEFSHALLAATVANQLCPVRRLEESAYITAMFQNLGSMLAWLHFPDDAQDIEEKQQSLEDAAPDQPPCPAQLQTETLGLSFEDLGVEIARQWGWPDVLQQALRPMIPEDREQPVEAEQFLRVACSAANQLARRLATLSPAEMEECARQFHLEWGTVLGTDEADWPGLIERSLQQWNEMTVVLGLPRKQGSAPAAASSGKPGLIAPRQGTVRQALSQGLLALKQASQGGGPLESVIQILMTQLCSALELQRAIVCLREPAPAQLKGRYAIGHRANALMPAFQVPLAPPSDLFGLLAFKNADTLINDTADPSIARHLPPWYRARMHAQTFVVLPLNLSGQPLGLIYGDRELAGSLVIGERELGLLKSMRNELLDAMRRRSGSPPA
jgi:HD-like signal output (HDOD) protein